MPQHPTTGDAGARRRPRATDGQRRAAWDAAFEQLNAGLAVPAEVHEALLRPGLFEGLDAVAAHEEAVYVVRYWLHGFDWSPIPPRGPAIAANWPFIEPTFGAHRADEALQNYIQASRHDPAQPDFRANAVYGNVVSGFQQWPVALFYIVAVLGLGLHIAHGVWSMFQSIGLHHPKYEPVIRRSAVVLSSLIVAGYVSIPIAVLIGVVR